MSLRFLPSDLLWPDLSVFVEAIVTKWEYCQPLQGQLAGNAEFHGRWCPCLVSENTSHLYGVARGYSDMLQCDFREQGTPSGGRPTNPTAQDNEYFRRLMIVTFGHAFERIRSDIEATFGKTRNSWPRTLDFAYHIRNGCFHGNAFNITVTVYADTKWRGAEITTAMNGDQVMGKTSGLLGLADVIALMYDIQNEMKTANKWVVLIGDPLRGSPNAHP